MRGSHTAVQKPSAITILTQTTRHQVSPDITLTQLCNCIYMQSIYTTWSCVHCPFALYPGTSMDEFILPSTTKYVRGLLVRADFLLKIAVMVSNNNNNQQQQQWQPKCTALIVLSCIVINKTLKCDRDLQNQPHEHKLHQVIF